MPSMHALTPLFILFNFNTPNRDNEHSPEITQNSIVFPRASLSFEPQQAQSQSIIFFTIYTYIRNEVCVDIASTCRNMLPLVPTRNSFLQVLVQFHVLSHFQLIILHLFQRGLL